MSKLSKLGSLSLLSAASLTIMVGCVIVPGLRSIAPALGVGDAASWLVTLPSLGVILLGPFAGRLIRRLGYRRALCMGLLAYGLFGFGGVFVHGHAAVFADRLLLGGATAIIMAAGTGLLSSFYEGRERLSMIALQGMSIEIGGIIFLFIGGGLTVLGWKWPFALYLLSWALMVMVMAFVPAQAEDIIEHRVDEDLRPLTKDLKIVYAAATASMILFFTGVIMLPGRLHQAGLSEAEVGYFLAFVSLVAVLGAAGMPRVSGLVGGYGTLCLGCMFFACAHLTFASAEAVPMLMLGGVSLGIGFGFTIPLSTHLAVEMSEASERGRNLAYLSMAVFLGQFLSAFMDFVPGSIDTMFVVASAIALVAALALGKVQRARSIAFASSKEAEGFPAKAQSDGARGHRAPAPR